MPKSRYDIIREIQSHCADINELPKRNGQKWDVRDGEYIAELFCQDSDPWRLFRYMDEKTGASDVGYKTKDGREWFHILRQMRNQSGSGLFENFPKRY